MAQKDVGAVPSGQINGKLYNFLMSKESKSGFSTPEQLLGSFERYLTYAKGDVLLANKNMARDFGLESFDGLPDIADPADQVQQPVAQAAADSSLTAPPAVSSALGQAPSVADTMSAPTPAIEQSIETVKSARDSSHQQAINALAPTVGLANIVSGEIAKIVLKSPLETEGPIDPVVPWGNPFARLGLWPTDRKYPRREAIGRGTAVSPAIPAPEIHNFGQRGFRGFLEDWANAGTKESRDKERKAYDKFLGGFKWWAEKNIGPKLALIEDQMLPSKVAGEKAAEVVRQNELLYGKKAMENVKDSTKESPLLGVDRHERLMNPNNNTPEANKYQLEMTNLDRAWRNFFDKSRSLWKDVPDDVQGYQEAAKAYTWARFNAALSGAPSAARGVWNWLPLGNDSFWQEPGNLLYTKPSEFTEAVGVVGGVRGMVAMRPFKMGDTTIGKLGSKVFGKIDNKVEGRLVSALDGLLEKRGFSKAASVYDKVGNFNPTGWLMSSVGTGLGKALSRSQVGGFGAKFAASEAGGKLVSAVSDIIGKEKMKALVGSKSAEKTIEDAANKALRNTIEDQWQTSRLSPLRTKLQKQYVIDTKATAISVFTARVRNELGKALGEVDDVTMKNLVEGLANDFSKYLNKNPTAVGLMRHPFGTGQVAGAIQKVHALDFVTREVANGALEGLGFGVQHLVSSIGPHFEQAVLSVQIDGVEGLGSVHEVMARTTKSWFDDNTDPSSEGNVLDSVTMGFVFGTKGLGVGHLPGIRSRNFLNLRDAQAARRSGKMGVIDRYNQLNSEGHEEVLKRVANVMRREGIPFSPEAELAGELQKIVKAAGEGKVSRRAVDRALKAIRGDLSKMSDQELAIMAAISRENALRFPIIMPNGNRFITGYDNIMDQDIGRLYRKEWASDASVERLALRQHVESIIKGENRVLEEMFKGQTKGMFMSDMMKSTVVASAIFLETGGLEMLDAMQEDNASSVEVANVMSHAMFSFMAGSHSRFQQTMPDRMAKDLDATKITKDMPDWLKNRLRMSALQAQLHYGGKDVHPFIQYMRPEINADSVHLSAAVAGMTDFLKDMNTHITNTMKDNRSFFAVDRVGGLGAGDVHPDGQEPITHNELSQGLEVLKALVTSGVQLPKGFEFGGYKPSMGQEYIDFINTSPNRAQYLGHVVYAMRKMAEARNFLKPGEEFTADTFYRMTRLSAQHRIGQLARDIDYTATALARLMQGVAPGRDDLITSVFFENDPELNAEVADFVEIAALMQSKYEILKTEKSGIEATVRVGGDSASTLRQIGRNVIAMQGGDAATASNEALVSAAQLAIKQAMMSFHRDMVKSGVDPKMKLGTPNGEFKNSLYDAIELTGRFIAGELFHFRREGGVFIAGGEGKRLTVDGIIAAAEMAGLFSKDRLAGAGNRRVLRPLSREYINKLSEKSPLDAMRLVWLHDTLSTMTDKVYTASEETGRQLTGMLIASDENAGKGAALNPISISKLNNRQAKTVGTHPNEPYNPAHHLGGFWVALEDAGIVINSRRNAHNIVSDLIGLSDMRMPESDKLGLAVIRMHKLFVKDDMGNRLIAPQVLLRSTPWGRKLEGPEALMQAIQAVRAANFDMGTPRDGGAQFEGVSWGQADQSMEMEILRIVRDQSIAEGTALGLVNNLTPERIIDILFKHAYGVNINDYIALGDRLIKQGRMDGWATDDGTPSGVTRAVDLKIFDELGNMPMLAEALAPAADLSSEKRAKLVENMTRFVSSHKENQGKSSKTVQEMVYIMQQLGRIGDKVAMGKLRYLVEGIGQITINNMGESVFTLKVPHMTQELFTKMLDRYEALELGKGTNAEAIALFTDQIRKSRDAQRGKDFLVEPAHNKGVTFSKLLKDMRIGTTFNDVVMQRFYESAQVIFDRFAKDSSGDLDMEAMTDEVMLEFRRVFRQVGQESLGNLQPEGPVTASEAKAGHTVNTDPKPGATPDAIERELNKLTRIDMVGLFNEVVEKETVVYLTAANAKALAMASKATPQKGRPETPGQRGIENLGDQVVPTGIKEGSFSVERKLRKRDLERAFLDAVRSEMTIELNLHDSVNNVNLSFDHIRMRKLAADLFSSGLSRPGQAGAANVIDTNPDLIRKMAKGTGRFGHLNDATPIVLLPFGDNKMIGIQVPKTADDIVALMSHAKDVYDNTSGHYQFNRSEFATLRGKLINADGSSKFGSMAEAIANGGVTQLELYNMYTTVVRGHVHGHGKKGDPGRHTFAMKGAENPDANKRYTQLASDSYRKISDITFSMAVTENLRRRDDNGKPFITESDLEAQGIIKQKNGTYKIRVQLVAESENYKRGGVDALDGNINVANDVMDLLAISTGFNPGKATEIAPGMQWAGWKGFIFGSQGDGFNILTKSFMTTMDAEHQALARQTGVAMFVPMSAIKIGKPAQGAMYSYVDGKGTTHSITNVEAAKRKAKGQKVSLISGEENIIEINASDLKFQAMHDPGKVTAAITAQLTQGMSHEAIKAFLDDDTMFPARAMQEFALGAFDHSILGQAEMVAFYEKGGQISDTFSPNDYGLGAMSLIDISLLHNRSGTASVMFDQQMKQRIMKIAKDRLFKGMTRHGGSAAMAPDTSNDLRTSEIVLGPQARKALVKISNAYVGVERTKHLAIERGADGKIVSIESVDFDADMADQYQQETFGYRPESGRAWSYNKPAGDVSPESVKDRVTTWVDNKLTRKYKVDKNGHIHGFLASVMAEIYGGGMIDAKTKKHRNSERSTHFAPLYELYTRDNGHITTENFDKVTETINNMFVDVITSKDSGTARDKIDAAISSLTKKDSKGNAAINTAGGELLLKAISEEMHNSVNEAFINSMASDGIMGWLGRGTAASKTTKDIGEITNGDLMGILDSILGSRASAAMKGEGYDISKRYRGENGDDLNDGAGLTPVKYGITGALQRSPSAKVNDTVLFHQVGFMDKRSGGLAIVNRVDAVDAMEADYDYDTFKYMFALPGKTLGDVARLRNVIGPLGSQKPSAANETDYTFYADSDIYNERNQYLKYIAGQHKAAALKGSIISGKAVAEKMMADGRGFRYKSEDGTRVYRLVPKYTLDEMQSQSMSEMNQIYRIVQKVLDTPGAMLPDNFELLDAAGNGTGETVDLQNFDVDKEIFKRLYRREIEQVSGTPIADSAAEARKPEDEGIGDMDLMILRSVRNLISRASAAFREEHDGDTITSRNVDDIIAIAREYTEIFGDRLSTSSRGTPDSKLQEYIIRQNGRVSEGNKKVLNGLETFALAKDRQDAYVDRLSQWITRLGDAMNGETVADNNTTSSGKLARAVAMRAAGDYELISTLEAAERIPEIRSSIRELEARIAANGEAQGASLQGQLSELNIRLDKALKYRSTAGTSMVTPNLNTEDGRILQRKLTDGSILGYAVKLTSLGIEDTLDPRHSALADMVARNILSVRNHLWGIGMSDSEAPINKAASPEMIQDMLNLMVDNYMRQFSTGQEKESMFEQLAIRLLTPKANALYTLDKQKFLSYEKINQDVLQALMRYDVNQSRLLLQKVNHNIFMMSDVFSGDPIIGTLAIRDQIAAIQSYDGRVGERKTMLRNVFKSLDVDNPLEEIMKENLTERGMMDTYYRPEFDGVLPAGKSVKGANKMLVSSIRDHSQMESNRGRFVNIGLKVDPASVLDIPGLRDIIGQDWDKVVITADDPRASFTQRPFYKGLFSDAVEGLQARSLGDNERPSSRTYMSDEQRNIAIEEANLQFGTVMSKVTAASRERYGRVASSAIIRNANFDIRRTSTEDINRAQADLQESSLRPENCLPGGS